ncbi:hypothetical protein [Novosphingobium sp.]|nr:hypothetical protein [Novosphingobium sp.]
MLTIDAQGDPLELPEGEQASEHAGLPIKRGTKLICNRWIREALWQP